jgi:hypothetical protein
VKKKSNFQMWLNSLIEWLDPLFGWQHPLFEWRQPLRKIVSYSITILEDLDLRAGDIRYTVPPVVYVPHQNMIVGGLVSPRL